MDHLTTSELNTVSLNIHAKNLKIFQEASDRLYEQVYAPVPIEA